ncbi:MAG: methylmalonyl-CoA mutase family protein [Porticoccaceae bacterium]|jgi:methylmalonyl-CoA mutase|nr:methylmalonyl-CoA mutase family protein [Porticoccaceae bacterium]MBT4212268.1 methylmalonyl-CoA mutase family protein [Porticoccaceae bacterium]MBT4592459.1 methylmalonyl-CoA mutase family protein [Porticoccaceae bacterium]MBT5102424.1 methylmalonyl-CoA mutase family protein [Porticoccaceae bacterium]MBT6423250.1 methylmalonyl-CoA mutase family protein [Porticoccaceae bacterium]
MRTVNKSNPQKSVPLRFVTAASLFDGHDASINIMRRILQGAGVEVIHLAHNRSVAEVVATALQEDVQGIAISSYQGGHVEYFKYAVDLLKEAGAEHIRIFGGGGGVIVPAEITELQDYGVERIYSPHDGQNIGLVGMIEDMIERCSLSSGSPITVQSKDLNVADKGQRNLATLITAIEREELNEKELKSLREQAQFLTNTVPVLGITGTGGAGKSSLTDELIRRFRQDSADQLKIGVLAIDPTRRKTGGALLGDRIRMNAIYHPNIYMRSIGTRGAVGEVPESLTDIISAMRLSGFDLVVVETPGIGQGDAGIVPYVDVPIYVMTPEFGAQSQLEKIDMLDYAELVVINKFDRKGSEDAYRDVCKQMQRNREAWSELPDSMPVFGSIASHFNDDGVTAAYQELLKLLQARGLCQFDQHLEPVSCRMSSEKSSVVPADRQRYLAEIADTVRNYHQHVEKQATLARQKQQLAATKSMLNDSGAKAPLEIDELIKDREKTMDGRAATLLENWPAVVEAYSGDEKIDTLSNGKQVTTTLNSISLSGNKISRVSLPRLKDHGDLLTWLMLDNLPGEFPYTAGVFPFKREGEDPARMFAGEGDAFKTNRRFKALSEHSEAKRLSTAFDSVTLYGWDPGERPDIYGKVGNAGVSICTLDDMKALYDGFDLCDPRTSVSMTINGPAPTVLAMFLNTAIDQQVDKFATEHKRQPNDNEYEKLRANALSAVRGTVQADILKEDQGQNTCIFSTEFSLRMMGDMQQYFIDKDIRNFYSVSISGYHIAEAGANPISQLAFTLSNGFTFVEAYLARGMNIDDFAPNLSFFFSNGMDPEYTVMGRVARRIWATAMRDRYAANPRSQKLKYHIQTSGRSLHAQEMNFNDIRTTLQALIAIYDNCNSLHTNAYDEAITTPTEESVRRALAIQLIINQEWGLAKNENPSQGAFIIDELTALVEEAVLQEFEKISDRGGVLGAMETGYQRGKIQEESMFYEHKKHDGTLPIVGVNTFISEAEEQEVEIKLARSTDDEKQSQIKRLRVFQSEHEASSELMLKQLQDAVRRGDNGFELLMDAVRCCSLGQITNALFDVGGQYRRNM